MKYLRFLFILTMCAVMLFVASACGTPNAPLPDFQEERLNDAMLRSTVLYYATDSGHIVPVMRKIPWEEGIGKATLSYLVATPENSAALSANGLRAVIPNGAEFGLRITEGNATVDIKNMPKLENSRDEKIMLETVVNTLTEFSAIDTVTVLFNGKHVARMPNGTAVSEKMSAFVLNADSDDVSVSTTDSKAYVTVYFPSNSCALQVPLSRKVTNKATFASAMAEMVKGTDNAALRNAIPSGSSLISAEIADGVATVNFGGEFSALTNESEGVIEALYNSIYLTAKQFAPVAQLVVQVNGETLVIDNVSVSAPMYANTLSR